MQPGSKLPVSLDTPSLWSFDASIKQSRSMKAIEMPLRIRREGGRTGYSETGRRIRQGYWDCATKNLIQNCIASFDEAPRFTAANCIPPPLAPGQNIEIADRNG